MLKFDRLVFSEDEVNQDTNYRAIVSKQRRCLIDAQSGRAGHEGNEIRVASETVEFFCQRRFDVPKIAQSLQGVIKPFPPAPLPARLAYRPEGSRSREKPLLPFSQRLFQAALQEPRGIP